ncbi:MAG: hypothetical protein GQ474_08420 [Sulfurimonas sp.]|nr:hypothetical protein [Sulfurimonas sp.]
MLENSYKSITKVTDERKVYFEADSAKDVWKDVVEKDSQSMKELCKAMSHLVYEIGVPKFIVHLSAKILYNTVYRWWGHYTDESDYLASRCSDMSKSMMAFLQRQYTLAHMGCSVVMAWDEESNQMLCFRSLDWKGADDIALATRRFSFVNKQDEEVAQVAGITAMVGVLTGAKKGFSVAINYAPWKRSAKFKSDPTFLIRQLLEDETINDYASAKEKVSSWEVGSPCFISICGVAKGEACVVELGSGDVHVREMHGDDFLIQTNHYDLSTSPFTEHNGKPYEGEMSETEWYDSELLQNSQRREKLIRKRMEKDSDLNMHDRLISLYKEVPVLNYETAQWTLMKPLSGEIEVYSCVDK